MLYFHSFPKSHGCQQDLINYCSLTVLVCLFHLKYHLCVFMYFVFLYLYFWLAIIPGPCWASPPLPKSPWRRWMISLPVPTIWPAMINPCDDIPPNTNQCTAINDEDGDHCTKLPSVSLRHEWSPPKNNNRNNSKKQWRRKLAKIGREMLIAHIYSLSCMQVEVKNKQTNCK